MFVIRAAPKHADLVGLKLVAVGGHTVKVVMATLDPIISKDNAMWSKVLGTELLTYPRLLFGLGLIPEADKVTLSLREPSGRIRKITLHEQSDAAAADWPSARSSNALYVKNLQSNFWFEYLSDSKTVYCQLNAMKEGEERFRSFVDWLFRFIDEHDVKRLVIDLRWNTGGENVLNQSLGSRADPKPEGQTKGQALCGDRTSHRIGCPVSGSGNRAEHVSYFRRRTDQFQSELCSHGSTPEIALQRYERKHFRSVLAELPCNRLPCVDRS
jgi:hypothetical protein